MRSKRRLACFVGLTTLLLPIATWTTGPAAAQSNYPERPIRIITINAAGGPADISARLIGDKLSAVLRQPVLVELMVGAGGNLAAGHVAKAVPDGYTLLMSGDAAMTTNVTLYKNLPYDPRRDLAPITQVIYTPNVLAVHPDVPAKSVQELVALARAKPGTLTYAHGGIGFSTHLAGQVFNVMAGTDLLHVPFRTPAAQMTDLIAGRVSMCFCNISQALPLTREGKLRGLAVTALKRASQAPELPTMNESGISRLRRDVVVCVAGPGRHAGADHRQIKPRNRTGVGRSRSARALYQHGHGAHCKLAGGTRSGDPHADPRPEGADRKRQDRTAINASVTF